MSERLFYVVNIVGMNPDSLTIGTASGVFNSLEAARECAISTIPSGFEPADVKVDVYSAAQLRRLADAIEEGA